MLLQFETLRTWRTRATSADSDWLNFEPSQASRPFLQFARFWVRLADWAKTRVGQRPRPATGARRYFHMLTFMFCRLSRPAETLTETDVWSRPAGLQSRAGRLLCNYFLSSLASAIRACRPASDTAFMNTSALFGVATLPDRMLRNSVLLP